MDYEVRSEIDRVSRSVGETERSAQRLKDEVDQQRREITALRGELARVPAAIDAAARHLDEMTELKVKTARYRIEGDLLQFAATVGAGAFLLYSLAQAVARRIS